MEPRVLSDKNQFPTEEVIFSHIGKSRSLWTQLFTYIHAEHPDFQEEWRYYNDGKSWLLKVTRRKKTVFWLSVYTGTFRIGIYFVERARKAILASALSDDLKEQFRRSDKAASIKGIIVTFKKKQDVEQAKILIGLKLAVK